MPSINLLLGQGHIRPRRLAPAHQRLVGRDGPLCVTAWPGTARRVLAGVLPADGEVAHAAWLCPVEMPRWARCLVLDGTDDVATTLFGGQVWDETVRWLSAWTRMPVDALMVAGAHFDRVVADLEMGDGSYGRLMRDQRRGPVRRALAETGTMDPRDIVRADRLAAARDVPLLDDLVRADHPNRRAVLEGLGRFYGVAWAALEDLRPMWSSVSLWQQETLRSVGLVPVSGGKGRQRVLTVDPSDGHALDRAARAVGPLEVLLGTPTDVRHALKVAARMTRHRRSAPPRRPFRRLCGHVLDELERQGELAAPKHDVAQHLAGSSDPLGDLTAGGFTTEAALVKAVGGITGVPAIDLREFEIDTSVLFTEGLPLGLLDRLRACPINRQGRSLIVGLADPSDIVTIDLLRASSGLSIEVVACAPAAITAQLQGRTLCTESTRPGQASSLPR